MPCSNHTQKEFSDNANVPKKHLIADPTKNFQALTYRRNSGPYSNISEHLTTLEDEK